MKTSVRRGLIFPSDIHTVGITGYPFQTSPGPKTAPLPSFSPLPSPPNTLLHRKSSFQVTSGSQRTHSLTPPSTHGRSSSFTGLGVSTGSTGSGGSGGGSGSFGKSEGKRTIASVSELGRYTEDEDEDYDDVFGRIGASGDLHFHRHYPSRAHITVSFRPVYSDFAAEYSTVKQVMGASSD